MDEPDQPIVILITVPSMEIAQQIARALLEHHLAACINLIPGVQSVYRWEGQVQNNEEVLLLVKSRSELFQSELIPLVRQLHPYQLPELIALPIIDGYPPYLGWLLQETQTRQ